MKTTKRCFAKLTVAALLVTACSFNNNDQKEENYSNGDSANSNTGSLGGGEPRDTSQRVARSYFSDTSARADVLVLDVLNDPAFYLTKASRSVVASYLIEQNKLKAMNYTGTVTEAWIRIEEQMGDDLGHPADAIDIENPASQLPTIKEFNAIRAEPRKNLVNLQHDRTVIETIIRNNQNLKIAYADDFTNSSDDCSAYEDGHASIDQWFQKYEESYKEIILRHQIKIVSRSMGRNSKRNAEYMLRKCEGIRFEDVAYFHKKEQQLLDNLSKKMNVMIVNSGENDPQEEQFFLDGEMREHPLLGARAKEPLFVGYVDQPELDFFPEGMKVRQQFLPSNQVNSFLNADLFIDGNLDAEKYNTAAKEFFDVEGTLDLLEQIKSRNLVWWNTNSFFYTFGLQAWSPLKSGGGSLQISGMATSWATPLATGMILSFAKEHSLNLALPEDRSTLRALVQGRIFDPIIHNQFIR